MKLGWQISSVRPTSSSMSQENKERDQEKVKDELPAEVSPVANEEETEANAQSVNEHHSSSSDSEAERNTTVSVQNDKVDENTKADDFKTNARETENIKMSAQNARQNKNEKTNEELRQEIKNWSEDRS